MQLKIINYQKFRIKKGFRIAKISLLLLKNAYMFAL